jgi:hypothetical protein
LPTVMHSSSVHLLPSLLVTFWLSTVQFLFRIVSVILQKIASFNHTLTNKHKANGSLEPVIHHCSHLSW